MFSNVRDMMGLRMSTAADLSALPEASPLLMLFSTDQRPTILEDFLGTVLDESFLSKAASDAAARDVCQFPTCCDRSAACTG